LRKHWLATTALLVLPAAGGAEQLDYGLKSQTGWTSNVYGTSEDATIVSNSKLIDLEPVDDFSIRVSPWGRVSDVDGDVTWSLQYTPTYEYYLQETNISDFDHDVGAQIAWRIGDRTTLSASESFRQFSSLVRFNENAGDTTDPAVLRGDRSQLSGTQTAVTLRHLLTPLDELSMNVAYNTRSYQQGGNDLTSTSLASIYRHTLDNRTSVGLQGSWVRQSFSRSVGDDSVTDYYNISGTLDYQFSRTLRFEASLGPALIDSDAQLVSFSRKYGVAPVGSRLLAINANNCPLLNDTLPHDPQPRIPDPLNVGRTIPNPNYNPHIAAAGNFGGCTPSGQALARGELQQLGYPRGDPLVPGSSTGGSAKLTGFDSPYEFDTNGSLVAVDDSGFGGLEITYFARLALIKDWERWHGQISYSRSSDDSGSFGSSSVRDSVDVSLRWEPAPLWTVTLTGEYSLIDQASDFAIPSLVIVENEPTPTGVDTVSEIATVQRLVVEVDDNALTYNNYSATLTANRKLSEHSSVFAALYWYQQQQEFQLDRSLSFVPGVSADDVSTTRWSNLTLWVGFEYQFDTLKF